MSFSKKLRCIRNKRDISQRALAEETGLSDGYISMLETEFKKNPSYDVIKLLARALNCKVQDLIGEEGENGS